MKTDIEQLLGRLAPENQRQRQAALLRPLNNSLIVITVLGLFAAIAVDGDIQGLTVLLASLLVNLIVYLLNRAGHTTWAANLFTIWCNLGVLLFVQFNLTIDGYLSGSVMFASQAALIVMLAGMLLGVRYAFLFAGANVGLLTILFWLYFARDDTPPTRATVPGEVIALMVPISAFLFLVAIISWLYQRALDKADGRVEAARARIIQDELIRRDLAIARELQLRLYPPPPITNPALQIATRSEAARETSGDFYDFIELGDGLLGIVVADVTGKSVAAALMMALARVTIRSEARRHAAPAEVLRAANETICRDHTARQMITAFYGLLNTRTLELRFANAGHPYPILRRGDNLHEIELGGLPLGGRPETTYDEQVLQLEPGDQLFLISDGLVEERNAGRELFGYGRLVPAIHAADPSDPEMALEMLWQTVVSFRGVVEQSDDITLLVIQAASVAELPSRTLPVKDPLEQ